MWETYVHIYIYICMYIYIYGNIFDRSQVDRFKDVGRGALAVAVAATEAVGDFNPRGIEKMLDLLEDVEIEPAAKTRRISLSMTSWKTYLSYSFLLIYLAYLS